VSRTIDGPRVRLKYLADINGETLSEATDPDWLLNYIDIGNVDSLGRVQGIEEYRFEHAPSRARRVVRRGDVIISTVRTYLQAIAAITEPAENLIVSTGFAVIRPKPTTLDPGYCKYALREYRFLWEVEGRSTGVSYPAITSTELGDITISVPSLSDQRRIAAYLDAETARIDGLIAEKERFLALLEEKRVAIITRAVTCGLDPRVPMKPSGLDWAGEVPKHWRIMRLKFFLASPIEQGWSPQCENRLAEDEEWGVLKVGCVNGDKFNPNEHKALPAEIAPETRYEVRPGDILMSRGNAVELVGQAALVEAVRERLLISDLHYRYRVDESIIHPAFLVAQLRCPWGRGQIESQAIGSSPSMKKIGQETIQNMWLFVPHIEEQRSILSHIDEAVRHFNEVEKLTADSIVLLRARRSAVITAAVSGAIPLEGMT
jgi:type I restriction enzyme S subunit